MSDLIVNIAPGFITHAEESFQKASRSLGVFEEYLQVAGEVVQLSFAGRAMQTQMMPALNHLRISDPETQTSLILHIWESTNSGVSLTPPNWTLPEADALAGFTQADLQSHYAFYNAESGVLSTLDVKDRSGYIWTHDAAQLPVYEKGAPLLYLFHWWLASRGKRLVHAGAVGTVKGAVLIAGRGGSGKSTTSVACLTQGFKYLSDDYCIISFEPSPIVHSLYNTAKLTRESCQHLKVWLPSTEESLWDHQEKQHFFLSELMPQQIAISMPIRAILLPRITGDAVPYLAAVNPILALKELAPSTIFQLRGASESGLRLMRELVQKVPCFQLNLSGNVIASADVIRGLLEKNL
jgi:hypothetical protein